MKRNSLVPGLCTLLAIASVSSLHGQPRRLSGAPHNGRVRLEGQVHPLAVAANDLGSVDASTSITNLTVSFALTDEQQADLDALLLAQRTPGSSEYHRWISPDEYADR